MRDKGVKYVVAVKLMRDGVERVTNVGFAETTEAWKVQGDNVIQGDFKELKPGETILVNNRAGDLVPVEVMEVTERNPGTEVPY